MKTIKNYLFIFITVLSFFYACFAFVLAVTNPIDWEQKQRSYFVLCVIFFSALVSCIYFLSCKAKE